MRAFYAIVLLFLVAAITTFAIQNKDSITIKFLGGSWEISLALLVAALYFLGMLSGWTVVGLIKKSLKCVAERPHEH
ncbi:MAG: LapA family protein [Gemmataceae bacterium]|nr:LapA family protein [Gemmataceae bacterium]